MASKSRREFFQWTAAAGMGGWLCSTMTPGGRTMADETKSANARPRVGGIGVGNRGLGDVRDASRYGDIVAIADVDKSRADQAAAAKKAGEGKAASYQDYRKILDRDDVDLVVIGTPDHWHSKIAIEAMKAGKDVYCEKPLTLTIDEGKKICQAAQETGRVFQVGTQQRSEFANRFLLAVALVHLGRIGKVKRVTCSIGTGERSGELKTSTPPAELDWDMWLGQTPKVDYIKERCHHSFRWWYEYSGGKMTDWGAHHIDIAQWALGMEHSGPKVVEMVSVEHPNPLKDGYPTDPHRYNTATTFQVRCKYASGAELVIRNEGENGITFEGEDGKFFVNRGKIVGEPIDALKDDPIDDSILVGLRKGKRLDSHMGNFFECVRDRATPVSDVWTHHRTMTTCHLANIALRLGRDLNWDPIAEQIVGDDEANGWLSREQRKGYEVTV
jgi:predicted dehydrogenase